MKSLDKMSMGTVEFGDRALNTSHGFEIKYANWAPISGERKVSLILNSEPSSTEGKFVFLVISLESMGDLIDGAIHSYQYFDGGKK